MFGGVEKKILLCIFVLFVFLSFCTFVFEYCLLQSAVGNVRVALPVSHCSRISVTDRSSSERQLESGNNCPFVIILRSWRAMEGLRNLVALLFISVFAFVAVLAEEVLFLIIQHLLWVQELHLQHFRHLRWMKRRRRFPRRVSHQPRNSRFHINQVSHWVSRQVS